MLKYLLYLTIASLSLGQFGVIYKAGDASVYLYDIMAGAFSVIGLIYFLTKKRFTLGKNYLFYFIFTAFALFSLIFSLFTFTGDQVLIGSFYLLRFASYLLLGIVVFNMVECGMIKESHIYRAILISGIFIVMVGLVQLTIFPDFEKLDVSLGWDPHKNRLNSTFFDPNFTGAYLSVCLVLILNALTKREKVVLKEKRFYILSLIPILLGILLTFSRSAWLMTATIILIYGLARNRYLLFMALLICMGAYIAVPRIQTRISGVTDPNDSAQLRWTSWSNTWEIAKDNIVVGTGFNTFRYAQKEYAFLNIDNENVRSGAGSDSSLLFILATTGIGGLLLYLCGLISPIYHKVDRLLNFALLVGLLINSLFINSLFYPQIMFLYFVLIGGKQPKRSFSRI